MRGGAVREPEIVEQEVAPTLPMKAGGTVDVQVATARAFPRSVAKFIQSATEMATMSQEIAMSCVYAIPRDGEMIEGPSARLAEIVASAWGNLRIQAGASEHDDRYITARGEAWDVQQNVAIGFEVKRRITNRQGKTFSDDMIATTGNAAASIALRNAVLKAVPSPFWRPIYLQCRKVIAGDARTFGARRDEALKQFGVIGVTEQRLCASLGLKGKADITLEHMATLAGILNALKEGETTVEEAFPDSGSPHGMPQPAQRVQQQPAAEAQAPQPATPNPEPTAEKPAAEERPAHIGRIADIQEKGVAAFIILDTGFVAGSQVPAVIAAAKNAREAGAIVELVTRPPADVRYKPTLLEVKERVDLMEGQQ